MKKVLSLLLCAALILSSLTGCSSSAATSGNGSAAGKKIISIATVQPENHPISHGLRAMKEYVETELGDNCEVHIFYNGIMGDNSQALELLQMGTLNLVATSGSNLEAFSNTYKIFGIPYMFDNEQSFRACMNTPEFIEPVYNCTKEKGIQGVTWFANGVNNIYCTKPVYTPDDMKGLKFRIQPSTANVMLAEAWGSAATVLAYGEVYTALQNHVIDAASNPEMALISVKHGEVAPYYSRTEHQIFTDMLIANTSFIDGLSEREAEVMKQAFVIANQVECETWDAQINDCITQAEEMGVEFIVVDKEPFKEKQVTVRENLLSQNPELVPLYEIVQTIQGGK